MSDQSAKRSSRLSIRARIHLTIFALAVLPIGASSLVLWASGARESRALLILTPAVLVAYFAAAVLTERWWCRPLSRLVLQAGNDPVPSCRALLRRQDEWGVLARHLEHLHEGVRQGREKVLRTAQLLQDQSKRACRQMRQIQREAWEDRLTGVQNRRFLDVKFPEIFAAHRRSGRDLSVVMLDLDHFKHLNDSCGHSAGDRILVFVGELLRQCLRPEDIAIRYGGDEFLLLLPGANKDGALKLARRLMALFAQRTKTMVKVEPRAGLTAGIASLHEHGATTPGTLLALADHALCKAKKHRRGSAHVTPGLRAASSPPADAQSPAPASTAA